MLRCWQKHKILALVRVGDTTLAVVDTGWPSSYYVGRIGVHGELLDDAGHFFHDLANARAELERLEKQARS